MKRKSGLMCATAVFAAVAGGCQHSIYGDWQLASIEGEPVAQAKPEAARLPTLSVTADGRVSGIAGINRFTGSTDADLLRDGDFRLGPVATTRMAGPPEAMAFENRFTAALGAVTGYEVQDGTLMLLDTSTERLTFEPGGAQ